MHTRFTMPGRCVCQFSRRMCYILIYLDMNIKNIYRYIICLNKMYNKIVL